MAAHPYEIKPGRGSSLQSGSDNKNREKSALEIIVADAARHKRLLIATAAVFLLAMSFFFYSDAKALFLIISFIALGAVSRIWQRFIPLSVGVDLIMLFTVISGAMYGSFAGLIVGLVSLAISAALTNEDIASMWPSFFAIAVVGYFAGALPISDISAGGLELTVFYDAMIFVAYALLGLAGIRTVFFVATHIAFNYFVFYNIAPSLIKLLA